MKFFSSFYNVFKIFVKIFVQNESTGSVVTYLIFEFLITACCTYTRRPLYVCIVHTVHENALLFSLEY